MAAPKGSKYALGFGRPPKYEETPSELERMESNIYEYFEYCEGEFEEKDTVITDKEGNSKVIKEQFWIRKPEPLTVTGLTIALGFGNKSTLYDYESKPYFSNLIKRALSFIEKQHEISVAYGDKCTGNIFVLKNMGWKDKSEFDHTNKGEKFETHEPVKIVFKKKG